MESLIFLALMFLVGGVLQTLAQRKQRQRRAPPRARTPHPRRPSRPDSPTDTADDEEEPRDLLEALRRAYEQAQVEPEPPAPIRIPRIPPSRPDQSLEEMIEETESLEVEPEVTSLETMPTRREREVFDQDEAAGAVIAERIKWAEEHAKPISPADHQAFDQRIRVAPAVAQAVPSEPADRHALLRKMVVWHEVLGRPKGLR